MEDSAGKSDLRTEFDMTGGMSWKDGDSIANTAARMRIAGLVAPHVVVVPQHTATIMAKLPHPAFEERGGGRPERGDGSQTSEP